MMIVDTIIGGVKLQANKGKSKSALQEMKEIIKGHLEDTKK
jgi:hypothetical protein